VDDRVKVAAPVNMISAHFQGGCVCENNPGLRMDTYNVEIAALAAPRPLLMVSATGDWTVNTPRVEYPAVRSVYALHGAEDKLATAQVDAPHNYSAASRDHVYRWFARWFLGDESVGADAERSFEVVGDESLRVFPTDILPEGALDARGLAEATRSSANERLSSLVPGLPSDVQCLRDIVRTRLGHVLGVTVPAVDDVLCSKGAVEEIGDWRAQIAYLGRRDKADRVPVRLCLPQGEEWPDEMLLVVHGAGQPALQDIYGDPDPLCQRFLDAGYGLMIVEPFGTGQTPRESAPRHDQDWFWSTMNQPILGARVQDILTALAFLSGKGLRSLSLVGMGQAGCWAVFAAALSDVDCRVCADLGALDPDDDEPYLGNLFAASLRAYGDVRVASAAISPRPLLLMNTGGRFPDDWARAAYSVVPVPHPVHTLRSAVDAESLLAWLDVLRDEGSG